VRDRPASRPHPPSSTLRHRPAGGRRWFERIGEWAVILFLRCPGRADVRGGQFLAGDADLSAGRTDEGPVPVRFGRARHRDRHAARASALRRAIFAIFGYIVFAYDWKLAVDVLPVLSVAIVYVTCPWNSHVRSDHPTEPPPVRLVAPGPRLQLFRARLMKNLQPRRRDRRRPDFPTVTEDLFIKLFYCATDPQLKTGCWLMAFR